MVFLVGVLTDVILDWQVLDSDHIIALGVPAGLPVLVLECSAVYRAGREH